MLLVFLSFLCLLSPRHQVLAASNISPTSKNVRGAPMVATKHAIQHAVVGDDIWQVGSTTRSLSSGMEFEKIVSAMDWSDNQKYPYSNDECGWRFLLNYSWELYVWDYHESTNRNFVVDSSGFLKNEYGAANCFIPIGWMDSNFDGMRAEYEKIVKLPCTDVERKPANWQWNDARDNIFIQVGDNKLCLSTVKGGTSQSEYKSHLKLRQCDQSQEQIWLEFSKLVKVRPPTGGSSCLHVTTPFFWDHGGGDASAVSYKPCDEITRRLDQQSHWYYSYSDEKLHSGGKYELCLASGMKKLTKCENAPTFVWEPNYANTGGGRIIGEATPPPSSAPSAPTLPPLTNDCESKTREIETNAEVMAAFETVTLSSSNVAGTTFYSYEDSTSFETTCQLNGGKFESLNFQATCNGDGAQVKMDVGNRPACYSTKCTDADFDRLLEEFTMRPTEVRADDELQNKGPWTCTAGNDTNIEEETDGVIDVCVRETAAIAATDSLEATFDALTPELKDKKKFFIITLKEKDVIFQDDVKVESYETACKNGEYNFTMKEDFTVACTTSVGITKTRELIFPRFPACIGGTCAKSEEQEKLALELLLTRKVGKPGESCTMVSGAATLSTAFAVTLWVFSLGYGYWFLI